MLEWIHTCDNVNLQDESNGNSEIENVNDASFFSIKMK